jgi:hypothetical protein
MFLLSGGIIAFSKDKARLEPQVQPEVEQSVQKPAIKTETRFYIDLSRNGKLVEISKNEVAWAKKNGYKIVEQ